MGEYQQNNDKKESKKETHIEHGSTFGEWYKEVVHSLI